MGYTYTISCRMNEEDRAQLLKHADTLELSTSEYLRYLIRLPISAKEADDTTRCIVVRTRDLEDIDAELTKWGYHYNQAVHAMNTIALFIRRGRVDYDHFSTSIQTIETELAMVRNACEEFRQSFQTIEDSVLIGG